MEYRSLATYKAFPICFGTSKFVKGRLNPNADSEVGKRSLEYALFSGVNFIHSNPNLGTQWAIKEVTSNLSVSVNHLIKIELPLERNYSILRGIFMDKLQQSLDSLSAGRVTGIIYEKDKKRATIDQLTNTQFISDNYAMVKDIFDESKLGGRADLLFSFVDTRKDMDLAIRSGKFKGVAAYFSLFDTWSADYFDYLHNCSLDFLAIRPLRHGIFTGKQISCLDSEYGRSLFKVMGNGFLNGIGNLMSHSFNKLSLHELSIKFALAHPAVKMVVVGASRYEHFSEIINAAEEPLDPALYLDLLNRLKILREV